MRAVLLRKIHINKITLGGSQAPSIPAHLAVPGSVPGRGNLMVCTLTWEMDSGCTWPQSKQGSPKPVWPSSSWDVTSLLWSVRLSSAGQGSAVPAGPTARQPQPFHALTNPSTMQGVQPWSSSCFTSGVSASPIYSPWTAEPAPWYMAPQVSSPLTVDAASITSRDNAPQPW